MRLIIYAYDACLQKHFVTNIQKKMHLKQFVRITIEIKMVIVFVERENVLLIGIYIPFRGILIYGENNKSFDSVQCKLFRVAENTKKKLKYIWCAYMYTSE